MTQSLPEQIPGPDGAPDDDVTYEPDWESIPDEPVEEADQ